MDLPADSRIVGLRARHAEPEWVKSISTMSIEIAKPYWSERIRWVPDKAAGATTTEATPMPSRTKRSAAPAVRRLFAGSLAVLLCLLGFSLVTASSAAASGCSVPPCGALSNQNANNHIRVKWQDCDGCGWSYKWAAPGTTAGGYFNDGDDIDYYWSPARWCFSTNYGIKGGGSTGKWIKISSDQTHKVGNMTVSEGC
jgi:hypothetical protein